MARFCWLCAPVQNTLSHGSDQITTTFAVETAGRWPNLARGGQKASCKLRRKITGALQTRRVGRHPHTKSGQHQGHHREISQEEQSRPDPRIKFRAFAIGTKTQWCPALFYDSFSVHFPCHPASAFRFARLLTNPRQLLARRHVQNPADAKDAFQCDDRYVIMFNPADDGRVQAGFMLANDL